jgi:spectinomycin phosphotransferase
MLERPGTPDSQITACLHDEFGLQVTQIDFLPFGADRNTAVFRAIVDNALSYFVKLRSGDFDEMSIIVPKLLHEQGIRHIIAPLATRSRGLWASLGDFTVAVFPFVEGRDAYGTDMQDRHWVDLGHALKVLHTADLPASVTSRIQREAYTGFWRELVRKFQALVEDTQFADPVAAELAAFLRQNKHEIHALIRRAEHLAALLESQADPFTLCHADIHAGNVLIDTEGHLYVVDWDTLNLALRERDLMYVGGGQFLNKRSPEEEERLFYQGYGQTQANPVALAYYRYERIVQDVAAYCEALLLTDEGGEDRANGLRQLVGQFGPGGVIEMAYRSERRLPEQHRLQ